MPRDTRRGGWLPFLVAAAALAAADREPTPVPPYGAADFVPTPATPIGFRADGNGSFPGATPPIDWYEGTPTIVQVAVNRGHNRKPSPHWDLADRTSKNILWKAPLPGSSLSNPIVVGDRVICQHAPHGVTCHDARTGELLWRDELGVMHLPVLDEHRGLGPAPDAARAKAEQTAWELTRAGYLLVARFKGLLDRRAKGGDARWAKRRPDFERALARARQWRGMLDPSLPQGVTAAFDRLVATFEKVLAASDHQARVKAFYKPGQRLCGEVGKMLGAPTFFVWQGDVVSSFSTPVSDGTLVAVCFPWGQVAAYRVTTGERVWAWRDPLVPGSRWMNHGPSPFMLDDLLLVRSGDGQAWMGLDKATGRVRWETAVQSQPRGRGANHGNYVTPVLMDLPTAAGGMRKALVTQDPPVLDPYTGKSFGDLLYRGKPRVRTGHGIMVGRDGHLIMGWSADNFSTPNFGFDLSVDGEHLAVAMANNLAPGRGKVHFGARPIVYQPGRLVGDAGKLFDPASGARLSGGGRDSVIGRSRLASATLCGAVMVGAIDTGGGGRHRSDGKATAMFGCLDVREPLHPRVLSLGNCLDGDQLPADPIFDTYLEGFDKRPSLGCYRGLAAWFGCRLGGVAPQGDRLYIQTNFGLYCIGPEALGGPKDEAATLAAIAAATAPEALADHLDDESPNHRRSALRRLVELREPLGADLSGTVAALVAQDPFEEVRAAAVLALDACGGGSAGWDRYRAVYVDHMGGFKHRPSVPYIWHVMETWRPGLQLLGTARGFAREELAAILAREAADATPEELDFLLVVADHAALAVPELTGRALAAVAEDGRREGPRYLDHHAVIYLGHTAYHDERVLPALRATLGTGRGFSAARMRVLCGHLPPEELKDFLPEGVKASDSLGRHNQGAIELACRRLGMEVALPLVRSAAAGHPEKTVGAYGRFLEQLAIPQTDPRRPTADRPAE